MGGRCDRSGGEVARCITPASEVTDIGLSSSTTGGARTTSLREALEEGFVREVCC